MKSADPYTADLFEVPRPVRPAPGALSLGTTLRCLLSDVLKRAPMSRFDVAARMSELTGEAISKHQLDSWTAESRNAWRFPLEYLAFETAVQTHEITAWIADLRGALGKVSQMRDELAKQERAIKRLLGEQA